jgi:hypothetical protein
MWKKHFDGFPNVLIGNTNILSEGADNAALRLRHRLMRTCYAPRDVPEFATNTSSELNEWIRVFNFTRSDNDISEETVSHTIAKDNSSFTDDLNDASLLTYIPSLTIVDEEEEMVEDYPKHDVTGEFLVSFSHNLLDVSTEDIKQFVAIQALKQMSVFQEDVAKESDGETLKDSDEWALYEDIDKLDSHDEESNDSIFRIRRTQR